MLVVDDEPMVREVVTAYLEREGFRVTEVDNGSDALTAIMTGSPDVVVLDVMLPGVDGFRILSEIRKSKDVPVIMLTARTEEPDRVLGLELGADDYLTKPFSVLELVARVKALFRRVEAMQAAAADGSEAPIRFEALSIEPAKRRVVVRGEAVHLTAKEFDLLLHFARHPGRVFTRAQLLDRVWGYGHEGYEHTVNSHINRLRAKIERNPSHPEMILTVWGVGYKFSERAA